MVAGNGDEVAALAIRVPESDIPLVSPLHNCSVISEPLDGLNDVVNEYRKGPLYSSVVIGT